MPLPRPHARSVAVTAGVALVVLACKPLMPTPHRVPGDDPVLDAACAPYEYVVVSASDCAFLKCDGNAAYAFCDRGRYMYCGCDEGETLPPPYHKADRAPREASSAAPSATPRAP